jgi:hypothetical protein
MVTNIVQDVSEQQEVGWTTLKRLADEGTVSRRDLYWIIVNIEDL